MAVMDFREGGYVFGRHKVQREFSYDQHGWDHNGRDQDDYPAAAPVGHDRLSARIGRLTHYLGALVSVGLMIGLLVWGWHLASRDVSGVPVIRALEGESRTTPDDPGGELSSYTGFAVNSVAEGTEARPAQQVAIAPAATGLSDEDVPMGQLGAEAHEPASRPETPVTFAGDPIVPLSDSESRARAAAEAERLAMTHELVENAAIIDAPAEEGAVNDVVTDENGTPADGDAIAEALMQAQASADPSVLVASPRPAPRPRVMRVASAKTVATDARPVKSTPAPAAPKTAPAVASASGPQVQLGAFDSQAIAAKEWNRLSGKFSANFSGKGQVIQKHESNGRTFWRLRVAGFDSISEARSFCASLKTGGTDCLALTQ